MKPIRLKITSDGTTHTTSVIDAETGRYVDGIVGITWDCRVTDDGQPALATAVLTVELVGVDVIGHADCLPMIETVE